MMTFIFGWTARSVNNHNVESQFMYNYNICPPNWIKLAKKKVNALWIINTTFSSGPQILLCFCISGGDFSVTLSAGYIDKAVGGDKFFKSFIQPIRSRKRIHSETKHHYFILLGDMMVDSALP